MLHTLAASAGFEQGPLAQVSVTYMPEQGPTAAFTGRIHLFFRGYIKFIALPMTRSSEYHQAHLDITIPTPFLWEMAPWEPPMSMELPRSVNALAVSLNTVTAHYPG